MQMTGTLSISTAIRSEVVITWTQPQRWTFTLKPTDNIVLAIIATNSDGPAGFIVAVAFDA